MMKELDELGKKFIGTTLEIIKERISPLNDDWVEESKTDDAKLSADGGDLDLTKQLKN